MNEEEIKKAMYRRLRKKLESIRNDLINLEDLDNECFRTTKEGLFIDGKSYLDDSFKASLRNVNNVKNDLRETISYINSQC